MATLPGGTPSPAAVGDDGGTLDALPQEDLAARYQARGTIGEGGMGEVRLSRDLRIGREVALKVVRGDGGGADRQDRFLREARIQAQLEHPSVVPVYDLGRDGEGAPWFTMKRVRGETLAEILLKRSRKIGADTAQYSLRKLLTDFGSVCLAVDYAHSRGVLHRDLKPGNIMLGDFGEVYVLDWGLAKVLGEPAGEKVAPAGGASGAGVSAPSLVGPISGSGDNQTRLGSILGTPGYAAPEQLRGDVDGLDARADVYALGAILFEILAGAPLHAALTVEARIEATLAGTDGRPARRAKEREIAPELDALCARTTTLDPRERLPSARALYQGVARFLDGDRDLALRRELASEHARSAEAAATQVLAGGGLEERARALREVGQSLALDPRNQAAARTLLGLLTTPPAKLPQDAEAEYEEARATHGRRVVPLSAFLYGSWVLFLPLILLMGIRSWLMLGVSTSLFIAAGLSQWLRRKTVTSDMSLPHFALCTAALVSTTTMFGPYLFLPVLLTINAFIWMLAPSGRHKAAAAALTCIGFLVPSLLDWIGVLPAYRFVGDALRILPQMVNFPETLTRLTIMSSIVVVMVMNTALLAFLRKRLTQAERNLFLQMWQLRQLIPEETVTQSAPGEGGDAPSSRSLPRSFPGLVNP